MGLTLATKQPATIGARLRNPLRARTAELTMDASSGKRHSTDGDATRRDSPDAKEPITGLAKVFGAQLLGKVVWFVLLNIILARALGTQEYGVFALAFWALQVLQIFSLLGLNNGIFRFVPISLARGDHRMATSYMQQALVTALVVSVVVAAAAYRWSSLLAVNVLGSAAAGTPFEHIVLALPFLVCVTMVASALGAVERPGSLAVVRDVALPVALVGTIGIPFLVVGPDLHRAIAGTVVGGALAAVFSVVLLSMTWPKFFGSLPERAIPRTLLRFSIPTALSGFAIFLQFQLDRFMIAHLMSERDVGIYSVAAGVASQLIIIPVAFNSVFAARMASSHAIGNTTALSELVRRVIRWSLTISLGAGALVAFLSTQLLHLSGREFIAGRPILLVLVIGFVVAGPISGVAGRALVQMGRQDFDLAITIAVVVQNAMLNFWLIEGYGTVGAATATAISVASACVMRVLAARAILGFWLIDASLCRPLGAFGAALLVATPVSLVGGALLGAAFFVGIYLPAWHLLACGEDRAAATILRRSISLRRRNIPNRLI